MGVLGAHLAPGLASRAIGIVDDEGIADAAAIGLALPAAEGGVAGPGPTPGEVIKVLRSAQVIKCLEVFFH